MVSYGFQPTDHIFGYCLREMDEDNGILGLRSVWSRERPICEARAPYAVRFILSVRGYLDLPDPWQEAIDTARCIAVGLYLADEAESIQRRKDAKNSKRKPNPTHSSAVSKTITPSNVASSNTACSNVTNATIDENKAVQTVDRKVSAATTSVTTNKRSLDLKDDAQNQRIQRDVLRTVIRLRYGSRDPYRSRGVVNRTVTDRICVGNRNTVRNWLTVGMAAVKC
jgi:hypothetical protein